MTFAQYCFLIMNKMYQEHKNQNAAKIKVATQCLLKKNKNVCIKFNRKSENLDLLLT